MNYRNYSPNRYFFFLENFFFCAFALLLCPVRLMELEVSINRYNREENSIDHRETGRPKSHRFFFPVKKTDACFFVWWSGHIWGRLEIWWNKKKKLLLLRSQRLVYIFSLMACLRSRDSNENLYSSQHRPQQEQHQQQTTKRQQQSIKNSSCPLVTDVVVVPVVDSQQNRSITQVLFLLKWIYGLAFD